MRSKIKVGRYSLREWDNLAAECKRVTHARGQRRAMAGASLGRRPPERFFAVAAATTRSRPSDEPAVVLTADDEAIIELASLADPGAREKFIAARRRQLVEGRRADGSDRPR